MSWQNLLKAPWVQDIDFSAHDAPRIGRYIKYLENLLDENHRHGFKRWWAMGAIKTGPRPTEGPSSKYQDLPHEISSEGIGVRNKSERDARRSWEERKKKKEAGESYYDYVEGEWSAEKDPEWQSYKHYTRDLPSTGLLHMKAYYERNLEIDSDLDIVYEKEFEDDPDSALEKADNDFKELIDDMEELIEDIRLREVHRMRDAQLTAMHHGTEDFDKDLASMKEAIEESESSVHQVFGKPASKAGKWNLTKSHHGWIMTIWPNWLPMKTSVEHDRKSVMVDSIRVRINRSQGPAEYALCYMAKKKALGEVCIYKGAEMPDRPFPDMLRILRDVSLHSKNAFEKFAGPGFGGWGATREHSGAKQGYIKEWHQLPEDSAFYHKGRLLITRVLQEMKKLGRKWKSDIKELTHGGKMPVEGERLGDEWKDTSSKKLWQHGLKTNPEKNVQGLRPNERRISDDPF